MDVRDFVTLCSDVKHSVMHSPRIGECVNADKKEKRAGKIWSTTQYHRSAQGRCLRAAVRKIALLPQHGEMCTIRLCDGAEGNTGSCSQNHRRCKSKSAAKRLEARSAVRPCIKMPRCDSSDLKDRWPMLSQFVFVKQLSPSDPNEVSVLVELTSRPLRDHRTC